MENTDWIAADEFCSYHQVSLAFISELAYAGLVEITIVNEQQCIPAGQLRELERFVRLHAQLGINEEGVEAIAHLLHRVDILQKEVRQLQQQLNWYQQGGMVH
jgi:hypothetical protein